jgi:hypothetical protein
VDDVEAPPLSRVSGIALLLPERFRAGLRLRRHPSANLPGMVSRAMLVLLPTITRRRAASKKKSGKAPDPPRGLANCITDSGSVAGLNAGSRLG